MKLEDVILYASNGNKVLGYLVAEVVSETFSATGLVLGVTWEGYEGIVQSKGSTNFPTCCDYQSILTAYGNMFEKQDLCKNGDFRSQLGAIVCIEVTTTVEIQGHLFTNVSETIEFIGKLTAKQKNTLWNVPDLKMPLEDFENKFQDFLDEKYQMSGASYEADSRWDNFVETEYVENYSEYVV